MFHTLIFFNFTLYLPCIVISVVEQHVGQMIDFGFSENEMMDECLPLIFFDGNFRMKIYIQTYHFNMLCTHIHTLSLNNFLGFKFDVILNFVFESESILERDIEID
jgi:hypothetical protein